jgi:type III secretion protein L
LVFLIRNYAELSRPEVADKVIKAKDFWKFKEAERALADALSKQEQIISSAKDAYEAERQRGYADGNESAKLEQSSSMVEIVSQTVEYYGKVETQMVDLVLDAVRKVVSDFDDRQRVTTVVKNCLDLVRSQKHLSLTVHPSQVEYMRGQISELQKIYPSITHIEVHPDAKLALDACVVDSEIGTVEASLAGQVEMLREALSVVFEQKAAIVDGEEEVVQRGDGDDDQSDDRGSERDDHRYEDEA